MSLSLKNDFDRSVLSLNINKKPVKMIKYNGPKTDRIKRADLLKFAQQFSNDLKAKSDKNIMLSIAIQYRDENGKNYGWRPSKSTKIGKPVNIHTDAEYDYELPYNPSKYAGCEMYLYAGNSTAGGNSNTNDCFYQCLKASMLNVPWKEDWLMKKYLGIKMNSKVDISHLQKIEEKCKIGIDVSGDHIRTSTHPSILRLKLVLLNGHYTIKNSSEIKGKTLAQDTKTKTILIHKDYRKEEGKQLIYINGEEKEITKSEFKEIKSKPQTNGYVLLPYDYKLKSYKKQEKQFQQDTEILFKESNKLINLHDTGTNYRTVAHLWNHFNNLVHPDTIEQDEAKWIEESKHGALQFMDKYEGKAYKYDVNGHYSSVMRNNNNLFPIKRGKFTQLKNFDTFLQTGIYRITIDGNHKFWKSNPYSDKYTSNDIKNALQLGLKVNLIQDDQPNALIYSRHDCITGAQYFGKYIDYLQELKKKEINQAKTFMAMLWGFLSEKKTLSKIINPNYGDFELPENHQLVGIQPCDNTESNHKVNYARYDDQFETNHARIAPFVLSLGRKAISTIMLPYQDSVIRCHTDGWI